jgi:hypothetical protein
MMRVIRRGVTMCAFTGLDPGRGLRRYDAGRDGQQYPRSHPAKH